MKLFQYRGGVTVDGREIGGPLPTYRPPAKTPVSFDNPKMYI